jgi:hypothetical protein
MYHSPGLRDGVFFRARSAPPCLPAVHATEIASVRSGGLGINSGAWESSSSVGPASCGLPSAIAEKLRGPAVGWSAFGDNQYPFMALSV